MSLHFSGTENLNVASIGIPTGASARTVCGWFKMAAIGAREWPIYTGSEASYKRFCLDIRTDGRLDISYFASGYTTTGVTVSAGTWYHVAFYIASATVIGLYVNGSYIGQHTTGGSMNTDATDINLGSGPSLSTPFTGDLAEIAVYNVTPPSTSAPWVAALAKGMSPRKVRPGNLVFYHPCLRGTKPRTAAGTVTETGTITAADHPRVYY